MTQTEKFNDTVSILVKAYLNDKLKHGNCSACAVGNLISAKGFKPTLWNTVFVTLRYGRQCIHIDNYVDDAKIHIDATGYSVYELAAIENAFELSAKYNPDDLDEQIGDVSEQMFNGLMAVVDVLAVIHGIDLEQKESAKLMFVK